MCVVILKNMDDWIDTFWRDRGFQVYPDEGVPDEWLKDENEIVEVKDKQPDKAKKRRKRGKKNRNKQVNNEDE